MIFPSGNFDWFGFALGKWGVYTEADLVGDAFVINAQRVGIKGRPHDCSRYAVHFEYYTMASLAQRCTSRS